MSHPKDTERLDVDVRFLLANERTLLAWVRTSLAIIAGGVALIQFGDAHLALGVTILLLGVVPALIGYRRFTVANEAIRNHRLPPTGRGPKLQVLSVVLIAVSLATIQIILL